MLEQILLICAGFLYLVAVASCIYSQREFHKSHERFAASKIKMESVQKQYESLTNDVVEMLPNTELESLSKKIQTELERRKQL